MSTPIECDVTKFPSELGCFLSASYTNTASAHKRYLGHRTFQVLRNKIDVTFKLKDNAAASKMLTWFELQQAVGYFNIDLPFFGFEGFKLVKITNDLKFDADKLLILFKLEMMETTFNYLNTTPPPMITDLRAITSTDGTEVTISFTPSCASVSNELFFDGASLAVDIVSGYIDVYRGSGEYTLVETNENGSTTSNIARSTP